MKLITVRFDDSVDPSGLPVGTQNISIGDGTTTVAGGTILALSEIMDPEEGVPPAVFNAHGHEEGFTGPPVPLSP